MYEASVMPRIGLLPLSAIRFRAGKAGAATNNRPTKRLNHLAQQGGRALRAGN